MPKWLGVTWVLLILPCQDITASSFSISLSGRIWPLPLPPSLHTVFKCCQPTSIIFCVGVQCASSQIQSISQAYHLKHTDVKMYLVIASKYILSYHFPHFCGKEKAVLEFCYVYFWYELKIWNAESCSLKKKKRNNTSPVFPVSLTWSNLSAPMLKEVNIHHQEWSSKFILCLRLSQLSVIFTLGKSPVRDAKHVKEGFF